MWDNLQSMSEAVLEYVNKHVSKQSKIGEVEAMKEEFDKTATHKIRRFKYKEGAQKTGEGASQDSENKPEDKASSQK